MNNKKIMIIGGTGALGKSLTNRWYGENDVLIFSRNEHKQEDMRRDFPNALYSCIGIVELSIVIYRDLFKYIKYNIYYTFEHLI